MPAVCLVKAVTTAGQAGQPDKKQLQVTEEGKAVLQSDAFKRTPLVVVTIAGPARTGKSTMLNCILKRFGVNLEHDAGFQVGHSVSDTTEGMWLWSEPVVHNNTNHRLVLLDIEGNDSVQKDRDVTNGLYCLGYALSSVIMWNLQGRLTDSFRQQLAMLAEATSIILPAQNGNNDDSSLLSSIWGGSVRHAWKSLARRKLVTKLQRGKGNQKRSTTKSQSESLSSWPMASEGWDSRSPWQDDDISPDQDQTMPTEAQEDSDSADDEEDRMRAVGSRGPQLVVLLRDFDHDLGPKYPTPESYLASALEPNSSQSKEQRLGAKAAKMLFKSTGIIMFPEPEEGARKKFGTLTDKQLGPAVMASMQGLMDTLASVQPRDIMNLNSSLAPGAAAGYLTGELMCGFLCQLVEQIKAQGMLELGSLGRSAVAMINDNLLRSKEAEFDTLAASTLEQLVRDDTLVNAEGLATYRKKLQAQLEKLLKAFQPSGPLMIQQEYTNMLQAWLKERLDVWEARATARHDRIMAKEVSVYTRRVTGEIIDVARQHLPGTFIMSVEAAEAAWDKGVVPEVHWLLHRDRLYEDSKAEINAILKQLRSTFLEKQAEANKSLYREVASSACIIKGTDSRKLMVRLDSEGYLRGVPSTADNLLNLRHWFLDSKGAILARLPMQGDQVAVYSPKNKAVWQAKFVGETFWTGKPKYRISSAPWRLGDGELPRECLFEVKAEGDRIQLYGMDRGAVKRKQQSKYSLGKANRSSSFVLVNRPMNLGEEAAFKTAVHAAMKLAIAPAHAVIEAGVGVGIEAGIKAAITNSSHKVTPSH